ncbi:aminoglycoside phosphotransferase [Beutenbergia cavernae DSM 12333]|uniref:Aminoglycoside phosphotransferase n=1 Tax=Beutenbergia cavernae (strain ATCC BAA-8 / DSM 12333 / CCUG 43141 / JCM 11478 / NBRC 16432 / NCIMB 13614 / HKI 0122) TaxID=471853 RepID=C5C3M9_BEUC1|nr:phosphotransferase [Beutenbergia cavernae]ACQ81938.1 aminoglycoside phosphotransferase [Beutenbergia cavernae DSM 12333]
MMPTAEMLWETSEADDALSSRFRFSGASAAADWLVAALRATHGVEVTNVDRLVISAGNMIAFLASDVGELVVKCSAIEALHPHLAAVGRLLVWLDDHDLPVSAPLLATSGEPQVLHEHLSIGVQRLHAGVLLDADDTVQARAAGEVLARLHQSMAAYDGAAAFPPARPGALGQPARTPRALVETWTERPAQDPRLEPVTRRLAAVVAALPDDEPRAQLVHDDIRSANLLWAGDAVSAILDFEETHRGHAMGEVAHSSVFLATRYHAWGPPTPQARSAFLAGYLDVAQPSDAERAWLEALMLAAALEAAAGSQGEESWTANAVSLLRP